nr:immunoglobulin heavy chain junction region [Macaca mulatta]MOV89517.1 immunoglobulin heavy chain junction region [Macaca mulatta]MOV89660.1 immunoglobulin heavy chain junction region [Macaca mulatta]MOV91379.1 immunoglobulin heavy chain junction region [Macaca mulatta]MOV91738.1 immunoglobulin heavy chain junction region [Macaca mulatta]
CVRKEDSLDVW